MKEKFQATYNMASSWKTLKYQQGMLQLDHLGGIIQ